jgi:hypothetical protein
MEWYLILLIVVFVVPIVFLPAAFIWYLNISGLYRVLRARRERASRRATAGAFSEAAASESAPGGFLSKVVGEAIAHGGESARSRDQSSAPLKSN